MADGNGGLSYQGDTALSSHIKLRVLATTDMHMHVLPYDYLADRPNCGLGLARTASLIETRRAQHPNTLLLDNGDFLQGSALGEYVAEVTGIGPRNPHPAIAAMNSMNYDAATLGNHDFSYGLGFLSRALEGAAFPFTVANARFLRQRSLPRWLILDRDFQTGDGSRQRLRIGIIGLLPPQTVEWDRQLGNVLACDDILQTAAAEVPRLRAAGADLVIALAHSGIGRMAPLSGMENAATALAALPGIDVVIAGHTHQVFPSPDFPPGPGIDPVAGTLAGKPAVMAGFAGSHLGVMDLDVAPRDGGGWTVAGFSVRAEPVTSDIPACPSITRAATAPHRAVRRHLRRRIARTDQPITTFFSLIGDDPGLHLVAMAQRWHVRRALRGTRWADLPVLSAAAPFRAGGRGGPAHYTKVAAGRLTERNLADLYLFPNRICAVEVTGTTLTEWLERSAGIFRQIDVGQSDAPLIEPNFPSYNFDVIDGLEWTIDLSQPARFAPDGLLVQPQSQRIRDLRYRCAPVAPRDRFVLATNSYRLAACGLFGPLINSRSLALRDETQTRAVLRRYFHLRKALNVPQNRPWRFAPIGATALFKTSPEAISHLPRAGAALREASPQFAGFSDDGFALFRLFL